MSETPGDGLPDENTIEEPKSYTDKEPQAEVQDPDADDDFGSDND